MVCFRKTNLLKVGEKQNIEFVLRPYEFSSFDSENSAWITEKGDYKLLVGSSSDNLPLTETFSKDETATILKTNKVLVQTRIISTLK